MRHPVQRGSRQVDCNPSEIETIQDQYFQEQTTRILSKRNLARTQIARSMQDHGQVAWQKLPPLPVLTIKAPSSMVHMIAVADQREGNFVVTMRSLSSLMQRQTTSYRGRQVHASRLRSLFWQSPTLKWANQMLKCHK